MAKKLLLLFIALLVIVPFFYFGFDDLLSLQGIQARLGDFYAMRDANPLLVGGIFFIAYVLVTAFSLPGAAIMTLLAGALFGLLWGTVIASFASSIGALLSFFTSRFLLRDSLQAKFGEKLKAINDGIDKQGAFYLFTIRLLPIFPFFLVNILMGLTKMKAWTYYWVSQIGMFLGTIVFVNAGTQLAQIKSLGDIMSPTLIGSFVLLGIFPLIAKKIIDTYQARKVYKGYNKPKTFDNNLVVIGAGAAGLVTSYIAAAVKAKVTLIEANKMGGDCLNYGCVPSKAIIKSAKIAHDINHAKDYGLSIGDANSNNTAQINFKAVMQRVHDIIAAIEPHDSVERYTGLGVDVVEGYGKIIDPWTVEIAKNDGGTERLTAKNIVIAAGAAPFVPPIKGIENSGYLTSDSLWETFAERKHAPKRLAVLGGGPIGCELTQAFARLGSQVTQIERGDRIMRREDADVSEFVSKRLQADGVTLLTKHNAVRFEQNGSVKTLVTECDGKEVAIEYDDVIIAVGRKARLTGYGLENLGIDTSQKVDTNEYLATKFPNIFAAGDVSGGYQFTHTAAHEAWYAAVNALFGKFKKFKVDYRVIPWVTFVDPEVARVGMNEADAKAQQIENGLEYEITRYGIDDLDRAITDGTDYGWVKVITAKGNDKILGATIVGANAGELLAEYVLAMKHGLGLNKILGTIHTYPTMAEANKYTAGEWKRANKPEKLLTWVEKFHTWMRG